MKRLAFILLMVITVNVWGQNKVDPDDRQALQTLLENYITSINNADIALAETFWLTTPEVSFINPKGHVKGWENIKTKVYRMFGNRFSKRDLKSNKETITIYGNMAVIEFYWVFDATFAGENPQVIQTKGRETQVVKKFGDEWKLVHVHYSNMPVTGKREGF